MGAVTTQSANGISTVSVEDVLLAHQHLVNEFHKTNDPVSPPGLRDKALLESAIGRQFVGSGTALKYATPCSNAASLMYGICSNHPFFNGNKRTALVAGLTHMDRNDLVLDHVTKDELFDLMLRIASQSITKVRGRDARPTTDEEIRAIERWLREKARRILRGERSITFGQLYRILRKFEYALGEKRHGKVEVLSERKNLFGKKKLICVYKLGCPGDSHIVSINTVKDLRQELGLREEDGVDSKAFYDTQTVIDSFIQKHRAALRLLAKH